MIAIYCLCDDMLTAMHHRENPHLHSSDADVMTTAIVAAMCFGGNLAASRCLLHPHGSIPRMVSTSRVHRRRQCRPSLFVTLVTLLGEHWNALNVASIAVIATVPISVGDLMRIARARLYRGDVSRGYQASTRRSLDGLTIHLLVTRDGHPVAFLLTPGSSSAPAGLADVTVDRPDGAWIFGDNADNQDDSEDVLADAGIGVFPFRKNNAKRPLPPWRCFVQSSYRTAVERTGSVLARLLPTPIHAVTPHGVERNVVLFVLAVSLRGLLTA